MPLKPRHLLHPLSSLLLSTALGCGGPAPEQDTSQTLASDAQRLSTPSLPPGLTPSLVKDIHAPDPWLDQGSWVDSPVAPISVGSTLYFLARDPRTGIEPWLTDGTQQGTRFVADFIPGINSSGITGMAALGNTVFVSTVPSAYNGTLWVTQGVPGTTNPFDREGKWTNPGNLITCNGALFFQDNLPGPGWKGLSSRFVCANGTLFFVANTHFGSYELWRSDGPPEGTQLVADIAAGIPPSTTGARLHVIGDAVYFAADDGVHGSVKQAALQQRP